MELELWNLFQSARGPNATLVLAVVIGIWITARFASVARENNAPILMKAIISVFALAMAAFNWFVFTLSMNNAICSKVLKTFSSIFMYTYIFFIYSFFDFLFRYIENIILNLLLFMA